MRISHRPHRVGDEIKRELAALIRTSVRDPRLTKLTLCEVEMSADLSHATVFFSLLNSADVEPALKALKKASGFLRTKIGGSLKLRIVPELHFKYDDSILKGQELSVLIDKAIASDQADHVPSSHESK